MSPAAGFFRHHLAGCGPALVRLAGRSVVEGAPGFASGLLVVVERAFAGRGGSLVVVAHRMTSALRADRILVLDGAGAVAGSHEELMATSRRYAELVGYWHGGADGGRAPVEPGRAARS